MKGDKFPHDRIASRQTASEPDVRGRDRACVLKNTVELHKSNAKIILYSKLTGWLGNRHAFTRAFTIYLSENRYCAMCDVRVVCVCVCVRNFHFSSIIIHKCVRSAKRGKPW